MFSFEALHSSQFSAIKAVIFDCDGTLVDSEHAHYSAWQYAFQQQGSDLSHEMYKTFVGKGETQILKMAVDIIGFNCSEELLKDKNKHFTELQLNGMVYSIDSTVNFLHSLFQEKETRGLKLAVASGSRKEDILQNLKNLEIEHYFDVILSGNDDLSDYHDPEGTNKPKPYVYLKAAKELGFLPEECIAIEDSESGVFSAVTAGCFTIAIPNALTQYHDLSRAHLKLDSLSRFTIDELLQTPLRGEKLTYQLK